MRGQVAKGYYINRDGGKRFNCAQAVASAFADCFDEQENILEMFSSCGSGRAPNGVCGAFYASEVILKRLAPDKVEYFKKFYLENAGSLKCREIRELRKFSCVECVEKSAEFVSKVLDLN